jgi:DNA-binding NarL/FixJ family response regulator
VGTPPTTRSKQTPIRPLTSNQTKTSSKKHSVSASEPPISVALVDDYDVVVVGVANMLAPYRDRVVVAELDTTRPVKEDVDIALYDSFAQPESDQHEIKVLVDNPHARRVVVYTWNFHPELVESARAIGVHGYLSKALTARELVAGLEAVHRERSSSARLRQVRAPAPASTGQVAEKDSPTASQRSWP